MNWFQSFWQALTGKAENPAGRDVQYGTTPDPALAGTPAGNFTPRAQQVLALARKEADRLDHQFIGTEHVLLGMVVLGQGTAVNVLRKLGLDLETVRRAVEKKVRPAARDKVIGKIPYTPRVKKVLALAAREAKALNHTYVGTEHILLGLLREGDGSAAQVLKDLKVDLEQTRREILMELDPNFPPAADAPGTPAPTTAPAQAKSTFTVKNAPSAPAGEPVDTSRLYDVYCTDWSQGVTVYRKARFKGVRHLFQKSAYDVLSGYVELELENGQSVFVSRSSVIRFCEPGTGPNPGSVPPTEP